MGGYYSKVGLCWVLGYVFLGFGYIVRFFSLSFRFLNFSTQSHANSLRNFLNKSVLDPKRAKYV